MAEDRLRFNGGVVGAGKRHMVGWDGPWPPPERMGIAVGFTSRQVAIFNPDECGKGGKPTLEELYEIAELTIYELRSWSKLPNRSILPRLFRGAEYFPI